MSTHDDPNIEPDTAIDHEPDTAIDHEPDTAIDGEPDEGSDLTDREIELRRQARSGPSIPLDDFRRRSRRSFLTGAVGVVGAGLGWRWVQTQSTDNRVPSVLRDTLEVNEAIWTNLASGRPAREYSVDRARPLRVNGRVGIRDEIDLASWTVRVEGPDGDTLDEHDMSTFDALPQHELVMEHKCIEGWSNITHWGGARFSDFHEQYAAQVGDTPYVSMETPDGDYYVGMDLAAMLHRQTLLGMRLDGEPLTQEHGAPLRLVAPLRYGIKSIKRIGVIRYTNERPADYWGDRGYDWYSAL